MQDTSKEAFEKLRESGAANTLRQKVFEAFLEAGPFHNLRLLEYLRQKELQRPKVNRIDWTRSNAWPRVTELAGPAFNLLRDLGAFRGKWYGKKKTLHFWGVRSKLGMIPPGWEKVSETEKPYYNKTIEQQRHRDRRPVW